MKRMIGIYLDGEERTALTQMAEHERRKMRDQAAQIVRDVLIARGYLPTTEQPPSRPEDDKA